MVRNGFVDLIGCQCRNTGMCTRGDQPEFIQPCLDLLCGMVKKAGKLNIAVAHFGKALQRLSHILLRNVADTVHLYSV